MSEPFKLSITSKKDLMRHEASQARSVLLGVTNTVLEFGGVSRLGGSEREMFVVGLANLWFVT